MTPTDRSARLGRLALKELREILRDRRTIITLVVMPLLLYPLLSLAFQQFFLASLATLQQPRYTLAFRNAGEARAILDYLERGGLKLKPDASSEASSTIPVIETELSASLEYGVQEFVYDVGLLIPSGSLNSVNARADVALDLQLLFNNQSLTSRDAALYIEKRLQAANEVFLAGRLKALGATQRPVPVRSIRKNCESAAGSGGSVPIEGIIPFILVLMTITGAVYPAIDLTAGERERGTLEVLVAAPVPRVQLLFAKYVAVVCVALLTATANLVTMMVTVQISGVGRLLFGSGGFSLPIVAAVFGLLVLFAAFFSAVLLVLTSFARSFKEAQAYLIPLMLASLAPGLLSLMPDLKLGGFFLITPLVNIVLLGRDLFQSQATGGAATIVVASTALYAVAAIALAARIFGSESVLYSSQVGWSHFLSRPHQPQPAPTMTGAMLCLALLFPAYFLVNNSIVLFGGESLLVRLILGGVATAILFGLFPLVACFSERIPFANCCAIKPASWAGLAGAAVLGISLWTFAHEIVLITRDLHMVNINDNVLAQARQMLVKLRTLPLPAIVISLAVFPAVFEELFFRGYLYRALRWGTDLRTAILGSAVLFGLFHLIVTDSLAFERFLPSTFLGLILAWIRWRTDSILPGMVLHAAHNGLLLIAAYYAPWLSAMSIGSSRSSEHLPATWLMSGTALVISGALLLQKYCTPEDHAGQPARD